MSNKMKIIIQGNPKGEHVYAVRQENHVVFGSHEMRSVSGIGQQTTWHQRHYFDMTMEQLKQFVEILIKQ